jgi:hypothetical protein
MRRGQKINPYSSFLAILNQKKYFVIASPITLFGMFLARVRDYLVEG